jgi:hypothetical protein
MNSKHQERTIDLTILKLHTNIETSIPYLLILLIHCWRLQGDLYTRHEIVCIIRGLVSHGHLLNEVFRWILHALLMKHVYSHLFLPCLGQYADHRTVENCRVTSVWDIFFCVFVDRCCMDIYSINLYASVFIVRDWRAIYL